MKYLTLILCFLVILASQAQTPLGGQEYVVQQGDKLAKVAKKYLGKCSARKQIVAATNQKAASDKRFLAISNPRKLQKGQLLWIPSQNTDTDSEAGSQEAILVSVPQTDCEIRIWYNYQVVAISVINEYWIEQGIGLEERAKRAFELRHQARINARFMMKDKAAVKMLQKRDMTKYGNPDGPTFDYLMEKNTKNGLSQEEAYESIIQSASRTSKVYNKDCK